MEEQERLMEEGRRGEQERLQRAIEEAERERAEEGRRRQEEEEARRQREAEEQAAREEAERARQAALVKAELEEQERKKRRSRVAEIMSRTRGAGGTPTKESPSVEDMNAANTAMSAAASSTPAATPDAPATPVDPIRSSETPVDPIRPSETPADSTRSSEPQVDLTRSAETPVDPIRPSEEDSALPPPASVSPVHTNGTNGTGGSTAGLSEAGPPSPDLESGVPVSPAEENAGRADSGVTSGEYGSSLSSLGPLSLKSVSTVGGDGDSLHSNVSSATTTPSLERLMETSPAEQPPPLLASQTPQLTGMS